MVHLCINMCMSASTCASVYLCSNMCVVNLCSNVCICTTVHQHMHLCINTCSTCLARCSSLACQTFLCQPQHSRSSLLLPLQTASNPHPPRVAQHTSTLWVSSINAERCSPFCFLLFPFPHWHCLQLCQVVAKQMAHMLTVPERKLVPMSSTATSQMGRAGLVEELKRIPGAPDPVLLETLPMGVAFHHAGVPFATFPFVFPCPILILESYFLCLLLTRFSLFIVLS